MGEIDSLVMESKSDADDDRRANKYLSQHPELPGILAELRRAILANKPDDIAAFLADEVFGNAAFIQTLESKLRFSRDSNS